MSDKLRELLKKALKDASGDIFYKQDKETFFQKPFDVYCNIWFEENKDLISQSTIELDDNPKIICYCGSLRVALDAFKKAEYESVLNGEIALLPCCMFVDIQREYGAESDYKQKADELHKRKIDICDEVFVLNVGGYIGESTRNEIKYAEEIGKPISYLEPIKATEPQ